MGTVVAKTKYLATCVTVNVGELRQAVTLFPLG